MRNCSIVLVIGKFETFSLLLLQFDLRVELLKLSGVEIFRYFVIQVVFINLLFP